jgi:hypothetical protein
MGAGVRGEPTGVFRAARELTDDELRHLPAGVTAVKVGRTVVDQGTHTSVAVGKDGVGEKWFLCRKGFIFFSIK